MENKMENIFDSWLVNTYIAHRGLHDEECPENSLPAFQKAIDKGYAIELDVRLLADNNVVVFHDEQISRMTSGDKYINNLTKDTILDYNLKDSKEKIPLFSQVLELVDGKVPLLIEIKNEGNPGELEKQVLKMLKEYKGEYAIQSFNPYVVEWFKDNAPEITRGILSSYFKGEKLACYKKFALKRMLLNKKCEPMFISYDVRNLPNRYVRKYENLPILTWVVRSQQDYERVIKFSDNIIFENFTPKI